RRLSVHRLLAMKAAAFTIAAFTLAAFTLATMLGGCSNMPSLNPIDWFKGTPTGVKPAELPPMSSAQPVKTLWQANVGPAGIFVFTPAVAAGSVYAAARDG